MNGVGLRPALDGAWVVLTDGGPIRAASLIEAERIMADLRLTCPETLTVPVGYDEEAHAACDLQRGHRGPCHWVAQF